MFRNVCRLCLGKDDLIWIFSDKMAENMQEIVYVTGGVKICKTDPITQMVCRSCCQITIKMYQFRTTAIKNDDDLKLQYANFRVSQLSQKETPTPPHKPPIPEKYRHAHFSIKQVIRAYPHLKLPDNCLKSHVGVYITLLTNEVDDWFKERNYTDQEIKEMKRRALEAVVPKKRKNEGTKEGEKEPKKIKLEKKNVKLQKASIKKIVETEKKDHKQKETHSKTPSKKTGEVVVKKEVGHTKQVKLDKPHNLTPSKAPNKKIQVKKEAVKPEIKKEKPLKTKDVVKKEGVQNPKKPSEVELIGPIVSDSRARKAKVVADHKIKYPAGERPLSPTNVLMRKMMTAISPREEEQERRPTSDSVPEISEPSTSSAQLSVPDSFIEPQEVASTSTLVNEEDETNSLGDTEMVICSNQIEGEERDEHLEETVGKMKTMKLQLTRVDEDEDIRKKYQAAFEDEVYDSILYCSENLPPEDQDEKVMCISDEESENKEIPEMNQSENEKVMCISDEESENKASSEEMRMEAAGMVQVILGDTSTATEEAQDQVVYISDEESERDPEENRLKVAGIKKKLLGNLSADATSVEILTRALSRYRRAKLIAKQTKDLPPIEQCRILTGKKSRVKIFINLTKYLYKYKIPVELKYNHHLEASFKKFEPSPLKRLSGLWTTMDVVDIRDVPTRHRPIILGKIVRTNGNEALPLASKSAPPLTPKITHTFQVNGNEALPLASTSASKGPPPLAPKSNNAIRNNPPPLAMRKSLPGISRLKVRPPAKIPIRFMNGQPVLLYSSAPGTSTSTVVSAANLILGSGTKVTTTKRTPLVLHSSKKTRLKPKASLPSTSTVASAPLVLHSSSRASTSTAVPASNLILGSGNKVTTSNGAPLVLNTSQAVDGNKYTFILVPNTVLPAQQGPLPVIQSVGTVIEEVTLIGGTNTQIASTRSETASTSTMKPSDTQLGIRVKDLKSMT